MKNFITVLSLLSVTVAISQPTVFKQAIISTTTNVIAPEEEDVQNIQGGQDARGMNFRNMMDGETKFVTYLKNDLTKTVIKSEMGRSTIYRDNTQKRTTTLMEMMGQKMAFYVSDEEQLQMQKTRDSMMKARREKDTAARKEVRYDPSQTPPVEFSLTDQTKKIAGYTCKKAYLITSRFLGVKDTATVWFTPEFKLQNILSTGSLAGMGPMANMGGTLNGLEKIDGFVMRYEMKLRRNRSMEVEVTKIDLSTSVEDKEFVIPKDIEIKPMSEMQNMFGGGRGGGFMRGGGRE